MQSLRLMGEPGKHGLQCPCRSPGSVTDGGDRASYSPLGVSFFILNMGERHLTCLLCRTEVQMREGLRRRSRSTEPDCTGWSAGSRGHWPNSLSFPLNRESAEFLTSGECTLTHFGSTSLSLSVLNSYRIEMIKSHRVSTRIR